MAVTSLFNPVKASRLIQLLILQLCALQLKLTILRGGLEEMINIPPVNSEDLHFIFTTGSLLKLKICSRLCKFELSTWLKNVNFDLKLTR